MQDKDNEQVMIVPNSIFNDYIVTDCFNLWTGPNALRLYRQICKNASYMRRGDCETNLEFRQVIPYCIFEKVEPNGEQRWLLMNRETKQGEERLHGKKYIGVGGHVNIKDDVENAAFKNIYQRNEYTIVNAIARELREELSPAIQHSLVLPAIQGILIDDTGGNVEKVHVGLLYHFIIDFDIDFKALPEYDSHLHRWANMDELQDLQNYRFRGAVEPSFEGWSQLIIAEYLY